MTDKNALTKAQILNRKPILQEVPIPQWGGFVYIRPLTVAEQTKLAELGTKFEKASQSGPRTARTRSRRLLNGRSRRSIPFLRLRVVTMFFTTRKPATAGTMPGGHGKLRAKMPATPGCGSGTSGRRSASRRANSARRCITSNQLSATAPLPLPSGITQNTILVPLQGSY
jgi:hypothetical protein